MRSEGPVSVASNAVEDMIPRTIFSFSKGISKNFRPLCRNGQENIFASSTVRVSDKGLDPWGMAGPIARMGTGKDISETLERFIAQPRKGQGDCIDTQSWEEAHLSLQGWYQDGIFENVQTVPELIERENWAVVKNCLPVCERWEMSPEEMVFFLNQVTESGYSQENLLTIGETLTHEVMNLYRSLGYLPIDPQGIRFCGHRFPSFFGVSIGSYLAHRKWEKTGFPEKS